MIEHNWKPIPSGHLIVGKANSSISATDAKYALQVYIMKWVNRSPKVCIRSETG